MELEFRSGIPVSCARGKPLASTGKDMGSPTGKIIVVGLWMVGLSRTITRSVLVWLMLLTVIVISESYSPPDPTGGVPEIDQEPEPSSWKATDGGSVPLSETTAPGMVPSVWKT